MSAPVSDTLGAAPAASVAGRVAVYSVPLLWMLSLAYACNYMDRSIVGTLAQAIKIDLSLTDSQLGVLQGFAYVVLYSVTGLPLAWLAERRNRVTILSLCLVAWSAMTMVCGVAQNFVQLLFLRVGVGIGEAGCNPCSHSMIADAFAPAQRSRALSIYQLGATIGTTIGAMSAGVIADLVGWRMAFVVIGAPGLLLALALRLTCKDPPRMESQRTAAQVDAGRFSAVAKKLVTSPALIHIILGFTLASFVSGSLGFTQPYFVRAFGLSYGTIGVSFGLAGGLASAASLMTSGRLSDDVTQRDVRWHVWLPVIGLALSAPCSWATYAVGDWRLALAFSFANGFFMNWFIIPTLSVMHKLVGVRLVAAGMALILMFQNLVGLGGGPYFTGVLIDVLSQHNFTAAGFGHFTALCPGGRAPHGAAAALAQACHSSITEATRVGLQFTVVIRLWACLHYALAARYVLRELGPARPAA
jgi:predicted MFS family arabinose efflux permease